MPPILDEFETVRAVCKACGWFRIVGYTGSKGDVRALIRIQRARCGRNVLRSRVIEMPAAVALETCLEKYTGYQDLQHEAYAKGLVKTMDEFAHYLADQPCPRCKRLGHLVLDQSMMVGGNPQHTTHKSWRVIRGRP